VQKLGGDDFDVILQKIVKKKFKDEHGEKLEEQDYTKTDAEEDKKSLSKREKVNVRSNKKNIKVTRAEFEEKISTLVSQSEMLCETILSDQNIAAEDLQEVFLVGGSTRIPLVEKTVERVFKKKPTKSINVDEAVVLGASLYAAYKGDQSKLSPPQKASIDKISVTDVCPLFFGTLALTPEKKKEVSVIIEKNTPRPCSVTKSFYTVYEGQEGIDCVITSSSSNETDPKFVTIEKEADLKLPPDRPAGQEIQVTYSFDDNGLMQASFKDVESGKGRDLEISPTGGKGSGPSNIDKFTVE
jgi:molecular chaperone DnaK